MTVFDEYVKLERRIQNQWPNLHFKNVFYERIFEFSNEFSCKSQFELRNYILRFNWRIQNRVSKLKKVSSCSVQLKRALCWCDVMGSYKLNAWYSFMSQFLTELGWMSSKNAFHSEFNRNRVDNIHFIHHFACMSINYSSLYSKIHCTECLLCLAMGSIQAFTVIRFNSSICTSHPFNLSKFVCGMTEATLLFRLMFVV